MKETEFIISPKELSLLAIKRILSDKLSLKLSQESILRIEKKQKLFRPETKK
jgi:histidine ammonia-lyase